MPGSAIAPPASASLSTLRRDNPSAVAGSIPIIGNDGVFTSDPPAMMRGLRPEFRMRRDSPGSDARKTSCEPTLFIRNRDGRPFSLIVKAMSRENSRQGFDVSQGEI